MNALNIISSIYQKENNPEKRESLNVLCWERLVTQLLDLPLHTV